MSLQGFISSVNGQEVELIFPYVLKRFDKNVFVIARVRDEKESYALLKLKEEKIDVANFDDENIKKIKIFFDKKTQKILEDYFLSSSKDEEEREDIVFSFFKAIDTGFRIDKDFTKAYVDNSSIIPYLNARVLTSKEVEKVISLIFSNKNSFGYFENTNFKFKCDFDKILSTHIGVFGSTEVGKTNFVVNFLIDYYFQEKNFNVVIFDNQNEYLSHLSFLKEEDLAVITVPITNFRILKLIEEGQVENLLTAEEYIKDERVKKIMKKKFKNLLKKRKIYLYDEKLKMNLVEIFFFFKQDELINKDDMELILKYLKKYNEKILSLISKKEVLKNILITLESLYYKIKGQKTFFLLEKMMAYLLQLLEFEEKYIENIITNEKEILEIIFNNKFTIFLNDDALLENEYFLAVKNVLRHLYYFKGYYKSGHKNRLVLVFDEADLFLSEKDKDLASFKPVTEIENIARRGRKYKISLFILSQRLAYLSNNALSQINTIFLRKINNDYDIKKISEACGLDKNILSDMTRLERGMYLVVSSKIFSSSQGSNFPVKLRLENGYNRVKEILLNQEGI